MGFLVWDADAWKHALLQELQSVQTLAIADGSAVLRAPWDDIPPAERTQIHQRLDQLALGLQRIFATQIPLVRVDPALFQADSEDGTEPPLTRLFQSVFLLPSAGEQAIQCGACDGSMALHTIH